jgi:hypothetical protein
MWLAVVLLADGCGSSHTTSVGSHETASASRAPSHQSRAGSTRVQTVTAQRSSIRVGNVHISPSAQLACAEKLRETAPLHHLTALGKGVPVKLGTGPGAISLQVTAISSALAVIITDRYQHRGYFVAPHEFVIVNYRVKNVGSRAAVPEAAIAENFGVSGEGTRGWIYPAELDPSCATASASEAKAEGLQPPAGSLAVHQSKTSAIVYPIEGTPSNVVWSSPLLGVGVRLGRPKLGG